MKVNPITSLLKEQLLRISPSVDFGLEYRPCKIILNNGAKFDNVYVVEMQSYLKAWGVMPDEDRGKKFILIDDVSEISESPNRLNPELANKIYASGESGMGYCVFQLVFSNGQTLDVLTGNAVDFVPVPKGLTLNDIVDVLPHKGSRTSYSDGLDYYWCLFSDIA